jgi:hypothetical protein
MSLLDNLFKNGTAHQLATNTDPVVIDQSDPPTEGQVLVATSATNATWQDQSGAGGAITSVVAGTALSGGGSSGAVTLNVVLGTSGSSAAAGNDSRLSDDRITDGLRSASTVVNVNSSAAPTTGQALIATDGSHASWQNITVSTGLASTPLWTPPSSANALDDEFAATTLDPAWQFYDQTANTTRTAVLNVDLFTALGTSTTAPRYTVHTSGTNSRSSWFRWQTADQAGDYWITKPGSISVGEWLYARMLGPVWAPNANTSPAGAKLGIVLCATTSGHPNTTAYCSMTMSRSMSGTPIFLESRSFDTGAGGSSTTVITGIVQAGPSHSYLGIHRLSSTRYNMLAWDESGNYAQMEINGATMDNIATLDRIGFICNSGIEGSNGSNIPIALFGSDLIRVSSGMPF